MSTLSLPASHSIPADYIEAVCIGCNAAIEISAGSALPRCTACHRSDAEGESQRLVADTKDLRDGKGIYATLTDEQRKQQLQDLVLSTVKDDWKPEIKPIDESLGSFVACLSDSSVDILADLVARRIGERRQPANGNVPTIVRVAIADLSDMALADTAANATDPIIIAATRQELARRFNGVYVAFCEPIYTSTAADAPDAATRDELESRIELVPAPVCEDEHPLAAHDWDFAA